MVTGVSDSTAEASATVHLPMAFAEGSPMHPAYGAGHATVAGACVTVLKAFFDTSAVLADIGGRIGFYTQEQIQVIKSTMEAESAPKAPASRFITPGASSSNSSILEATARMVSHSSNMFR